MPPQAAGTAASLSGQLVGGLYRDNTWSSAAFGGTDAATLALAVPTLLIALVLARRVYVAALGLAVTLLVFGAPRVLPLVAAPGRVPMRVIGGYLVVVGAVFGALWTILSLGYVATGRLPQVIADSGLHTSIVFALDLTLVVPWLVIAGVLLWRRTGVGMALGVVMNTLAVLYMAALATGGAFQEAAGIPEVSWSTPPYLEIGVASLVALALLLLRLRRTEPVGAGVAERSVR